MGVAATDLYLRGRSISLEIIGMCVILRGALSLFYHNNKDLFMLRYK